LDAINSSCEDWNYMEGEDFYASRGLRTLAFLIEQYVTHGILGHDQVVQRPSRTKIQQLELRQRLLAKTDNVVVTL